MAAVYTVTPRQADELVRLAAAGQQCAVVVPSRVAASPALDQIADRVSSTSKARVYRTNGKQRVIFPSAGAVHILTSEDVRGRSFDAAAVAAPHQVLAPALITGSGRLLDA